MIGKNEPAEFNLPSDLHNSAALVDPRVITIQYVHSRVLLECLNNSLEAPGPVAVVGIHPPDDLSCCHPKPFVQCIALALVWFRYPPEVLPVGPLRILLQDGHSAIRRRTINSDVLQ